MKKKKIPTFRTDKEAEDFVDTADLSQYDLSGGRLVRFVFEPQEERLNMRVTKSLMTALKKQAAKIGMPYQRYARSILEHEVYSSR